MANPCESKRGQEVIWPLQAYEAPHLVELLGEREHIPLNGTAFEVALEGYGYRWFRLRDTRE